MEDIIIQVEKLSKKYKDADYYSVSELSLAIRRGAIFGLLGPNGAGKTTLISMLCGLITPTAGQFTIDGHSFASDPLSVKRCIGVVPQEYALYPTLTAKENLQYFGAMYGLKGAQLRRLVDEALEKMGLSKFANKRVSTFSGGMKRRVNLIAGLLHQPNVLFLDEPTVGVDVQSKNAILTFLTEQNKQGTTIVYTSHHLLEAQEFCTDIAIIEGGKIIVEGAPKQLIAAVPAARNLEDLFISLTGKELRDGL